MKVLVFGGTGAMGTPLMHFLKGHGYEVHVTSRKERNDERFIWHRGNAHDPDFISELLQEYFDVLIDFMVYKTAEFHERSAEILPKVGQYIFTSSARVYAYSENPLKEDSPRLLDVCKDQEFLQTDEYALSKARQENLLFESKHHNWTIVRPSLTYNSERLQYAFGEKEIWLYRSLNGKQTVFPKNLANIYTTMSHGDDVAHAISMLAGNPKTMSAVFHIAGAESVTWSEVNEIYQKALSVSGSDVSFELFQIDDWVKLSKQIGNFYQMKYARSISRRFDNSKLLSAVGPVEFRPPQVGLHQCLLDFMKTDRHFHQISPQIEAVFDRYSGDMLKKNQFSGKSLIKYFAFRYIPFL